MKLSNDEVMNSTSNVDQPWSMRRPQRNFITVGIVILMIVVVTTGIIFIAGGQGGIVPLLMVLVAPALGAFYIWYFNFSEYAKGGHPHG